MWFEEWMRGGGAMLALALYAVLCWRAWRQAKQLRGGGVSAAALAVDWRVVFASQTGSAEMLARQTVHALVDAGLSAACLPLGRLRAADLAQGGGCLFVVSTAGEGDAPDDAQAFVRHALTQTPDLAGLRYAVLALGDRSYPHFNAFGRRLDAWLQAASAEALADRIELDRCDAKGVLAWRELLATLTGHSAAQLGEVAGVTGAATEWRLAARTCLNPGSEGGAVYRLNFTACEPGADWQSGDLVEVSLPGNDTRPRAYSIASVPTEGMLQLLVRLHVRADGEPGRVSHHLGRTLRVGDRLRLRLRPHPGFQLAGNARRPLILIGNGVGLAGLRAHLMARMADGQRQNWLIFGERHRVVDDLHADDLVTWRAQGVLARLDAVYSREGAACRYVQDVLHREAAQLADWVARGAAIYVCGSRQGMGEGVDRALQAILGEAALAQLADSGRYCRDVF